ncbi:MAG: ATP synthase F1 subunit delta [Rickettsiaceae bacterium]|nr:ATP synthase F1 subunit delta [Rickettsiaceae bacterium]
MYDLKVIRNYSLALFYNAKLLGVEETILKQLTKFSDIINTTKQVNYALCSPIVAADNKKNIILLFAKKLKFAKVTSQFLLKLVDNNRFDLLPEMLNCYTKLLDDDKGIKTVELVSALKLEKKSLEIIRKYLANSLNQTIKITTKEDKELLGGVVIKYDSNFIDCSVKGALNKVINVAKKVKI